MVKKTAENYRKCYIPEKPIVFQRYRHQILIAQIEDLNEDCVKISGPYLLYFLRNKPSKSVTFGPSRKEIELSFNFFRFILKVSELSECRRGYLYMTANRNFVRFAHS